MNNRIINFDNVIEEQFIFLINKLKKFITIIIDVILRKRYIIRNINTRRELRKYI